MSSSFSANSPTQPYSSPSRDRLSPTGSGSVAIEAASIATGPLFARKRKTRGHETPPARYASALDVNVCNPFDATSFFFFLRIYFELCIRDEDTQESRATRVSLTYTCVAIYCTRCRIGVNLQKCTRFETRATTRRNAVRFR